MTACRGPCFPFSGPGASGRLSGTGLGMRHHADLCLSTQALASLTAPTLMPKPAAPRPPGSCASSSYLSRQVVGKADRVRHMAAVQGSTSWGERRRVPWAMRARESSGSRRRTLLLGLRRSDCTPRAGERAAFIPSEGAGRGWLFAADQCASGTERGRGRGGAGSPPRGAQAQDCTPVRVQPPHWRGGALEAALLRQTAARGATAAEKSHADESARPV